MSVILMTTLFYKALMLQGENWYWSYLKGYHKLEIWNTSNLNSKDGVIN